MPTGGLSKSCCKVFRFPSRRRRPRSPTVPGAAYGWVRITRFGVVYVILCVVVSVAAINTGNNALFMVLALMLAALAVSGFASRANVRGLALALAPPGEVFARRPFRMDFTLDSQRRRLLPHWLLEINVPGAGQSRLIPHLPRRARGKGTLELLLPSRGLHTIQRATVASPFPFGLFEKASSYTVDLEILVYPELFAATGQYPPETGAVGEEDHHRRGWGHDLHQLRPLRPGDDPRGIHWKQTAKTGQMIFTERQAEHSRRVSILLDNGVAPLQDEHEIQRFEQLVSEAATAAVDFLERGYQVELVHREGHVPFAPGGRQRFRILEELALLAPCPRPALRDGRPLPLASGDPQAPVLRLSLDRSGGREAAA